MTDEKKEKQKSGIITKCKTDTKRKGKEKMNERGTFCERRRTG